MGWNVGENLKISRNVGENLKRVMRIIRISLGFFFFEKQTNKQKCMNGKLPETVT